jgi:tetratricopeptide (TPR) repeat protein
MRTVLQLGCGLALLLSGLSAEARESRGGWSIADRLYAGNQYTEALKEYESLYAVHQTPMLLFHIARTHQRLGNVDKAQSYYRRFLAADPDPLATVRTEAEGQLAALSRLEQPAVAVAPPPAYPQPQYPTGAYAPYPQNPYARPYPGVYTGVNEDERPSDHRNRPSTGLGSLITGSIFLGHGVLILASVPTCGRDISCSIALFSTGAVLSAIAIPLVAAGGVQRGKYNRWLQANPSLALVPSGAGMALAGRF